jgi:hypothetical protein
MRVFPAAAAAAAAAAVVAAVVDLRYNKNNH